MLRLITAFWFIVFGQQAFAVDLDTPFDSIDGRTLSLAQWSGQPILVVNTASQCAFTRQYRALQDLYDRYRDRGLVVVAVPSDDFNQELDTNAEVKDFCELQFGIDMPMAGLTSVRGPDAHAFFQSVRLETGFEPNWNFNKVLIGPEGTVVETFGAAVAPLSARMTREIDALVR